MKAKDLRVVPLYFMGQGALIEPHPVCKEIFNLAALYCKENLAEPVNLSSFLKCWVAVEFEDDKPVAVHGVTGIVNTPDVPLFRVTGEHAKVATVKLKERIEEYCADQGYRGSEVLVYLNPADSGEQLCPNAYGSMEAFKATPANRWAVKVR